MSKVKGRSTVQDTIVADLTNTQTHTPFIVGHLLSEWLPGQPTFQLTKVKAI